jgi:hypothetical protein
MMNIHLIISLIHILITGPLLIYIGIIKPNNIIFYWILLLLAIIIVIAFIYRYLYKQLYAFLYVHLLLFATLLFSISYLKFREEKIPYYLYSFLIAIGFASIGYHFVKIFNIIKN